MHGNPTSAPLTIDHSALTIALRTIANVQGLTPWAVRVLLAVDELGDRADTRLVSLATTGMEHRSEVRRPIPQLLERGLVNGVAADLGRRRRGVRTQLTLTAAGEEIVRDLRDEFSAVHERLTELIVRSNLQEASN